MCIRDSYYSAKIIKTLNYKAFYLALAGFLSSSPDGDRDAIDFICEIHS